MLTEGQVSDYRGAATMLPCLPDADMLIADKGYDSDWFREALASLGIEPCIPGRSGRNEPVKYDEQAYKQRNRIERMFGRLKDWRGLREGTVKIHLHHIYRTLDVDGRTTLIADSRRVNSSSLRS